MVNATKVRINNNPILINCGVNNIFVNLEVDTGSYISTISEKYLNIMNYGKVKPTNIKAKSYSGDVIAFKGEVCLRISHDNNIIYHTFYVVNRNSASLMGRDLCNKLNVHLTTESNFTNVNFIDDDNVLSKYKQYLSNNTVSNVKQTVTVNVKPGTQPIFSKSRTVPLRFKELVKKELKRLENAGIITKVFRSDWASPTVNVLKDENNIRICGDYSVTINKHSDVIQYPLPSIDDVITQVGDAKVFSKIDLMQAFLQLPLNEQSKELTTINTVEGLYKYNFLPFGLSSSPGIFQGFMCKVLNNIDNVIIYQDDLLILTPTLEEHNVVLDKVLAALQAAGIKVNNKKCLFYTDRVTYLGYIFDSRGVHPNPEKVRAILEAPQPINVKQLQSFMGLCNVYRRFIPKFSIVMAPLYNLLRKNVQFSWQNDHIIAFNSIKKLFRCNDVLKLFDGSLETMLESDASSYGIASVLMQRANNHSPWYAIQFVSRSLNSAEKNYSNIEREALSIMFGCERFRKFLLGRKFKIHNDQKPLQKLLANDSPVPTSCSARLQRWALRLSQFDYTINYSKGSDNVQSDCLSRLPLPDTVTEIEPFEIIFSIDSLDNMNVTSSDVALHTKMDKNLVELLSYIRSGFPNKLLNAELNVYKRFVNELTIMKGCIMLNNRVLIPASLRQQVLKQLHEGHPGICSMKSMARAILWYPGIDGDIINFVKQCVICQNNLSKPSQNHSVEWPRPPRVWSRIHIDHFFIENKICLVAIDALSKYLEVELVKDVSVSETIDTLRMIFSRHGLCDTLVSDNASCFTAADFKEFLKNNHIQHLTPPPYNPSTNGQAERAVRVMKELLKKNVVGSFKSRLAKCLMFYRSVPHTATQIIPSVALNNRKYVTLKDRINPKYVVENNHSFSGRQMPQYNIGDTVLALNLREGPKWYRGTIIDKIAINIYNVHVHYLDVVWKRHLHQLRLIPHENPMLSKTLDDTNNECHSPPVTQDYVTNKLPHLSNDNPLVNKDLLTGTHRNIAPNVESSVPTAAINDSGSEPRINPVSSSNVNISTEQNDNVLRRSSRIRKSVQRYGFT